MQRRGASKNDADAMDKIYADNYMTVNQDGSLQTDISGSRPCVPVR